MHSVEPAERVGRRVATIAAVLAGAIALAGVLGTILEAPLLTAVLPGAVSIKFNTAVGLTLASVAVVLVIARFRRSAGVLLGLVTALGAAQLAQDILGIDVGLDELLIRDHWSAVDTFRPGGMSPISAACFVLAGIAGFLLVRPSRRAILAGQAVAFLVFAVSLHALFGYACDIPAFYSAGRFTGMAVNAAAAFELLALALVFANPRHGLGAVFSTDSLDGAQLRRVLPVAVLMPLAFNWLALQGLHWGLYASGVAIAIVLTGGSLLSLVIVGLSNRVLHRIDAQRRAAVEEAAVTADLFRSTFEQAFISMAHIDLQGRWMLVNDRLCEAFAQTRAELIGRPATELVSRDQARRLQARVRRLLRGSSEPLRREVQVDLGARGRRWFDMRVTLRRDRLGRPLHFLFVAMDVTDRKQVLEQLRVHARILDAVACGVVVTDARVPGEPITYVNSEFERITGYSPNEVVGQSYQLLDRDSTGQPELEELRRAYRAAQACSVEILDHRKDGTPFWNRLMISPVRDGNGQLTHRVGILLDATSIKQAAQEREELLANAVAARASAELAMRAKEALLAVVSHELRAPLNAIRLWASVLLTEEPETDTVQRAARHIDRAVEAQSRLIADLLDVSRIASGKLEFQKEPQEVLSLVAEAVESALPSARQASIELRLQKHDAPVFAAIDRARIEQVLKNLLGNAIKFTPPGGHVFVHMDDSTPGEIAVHIDDDGRGIAAVDLPLVFQPFWQADNHDTRLRGGMGLGLHIVSYIIEQHGGRVTVHSEGEGRGSRFTFVLPILPQRSAEDFLARDNSSGKIKASGSGIIVVDDDAPTAEAMALALRSRGYDARTAHSVDDALALLETFPARVLISDIMMPVRSGFDLISEVRRREMDGSRPRMYSLAISGRGNWDRDRIRAAGFDHYMIKPIDVRILVSTIDRVTGTTEPAADVANH